MKTQTFLFTILFTSFFSGSILASENQAANFTPLPVVGSTTGTINTNNNESEVQIENWMVNDAAGWEFNETPNEAGK